MSDAGARDLRAAEWYRSLPSRGLPDALGIEIVELSGQRVVATMPVDQRTRQPFGILHGGASVALAETVASLGASAAVDPERFVAVGMEINANHIRPKADGVVRATATPIHVGAKTHVWAIEIVDERDRLVCVSRCTLAIVEREARTDGAAAQSQDRGPR
jgi:1,4-dihydroxy-2-naphthoyl-CoA hydrolase